MMPTGAAVILMVFRCYGAWPPLPTVLNPGRVAAPGAGAAPRPALSQLPTRLPLSTLLNVVRVSPVTLPAWSRSNA